MSLEVQLLRVYVESMLSMKLLLEYFRFQMSQDWIRSTEMFADEMLKGSLPDINMPLV